MSDNVAVLAGYTEEYMANQPMFDAHILVKPGTNLDSTFKAWNCDMQKFITINGWLWEFEGVAK